jgi:sec-independent protein translocase protein TatA
MDTIGPWELLIIVVVILALFGADRLPKMARSIGEGIREFRHAFRDASQPDIGSAGIGNAGTGRAATAGEPTSPPAPFRPGQEAEGPSGQRHVPSA